MKKLAAVACDLPGAAHNHPAGVVADHAHQIMVAFAVGDLIDPDTPEAIQPVAISVAGVLGDDPLDHPTDRRPIHPQQLRDHRLRGGAGEPHHRILERPGRARPRPRPRHHLRADTTPATRHAPDLTTDLAADAKHVEVALRTQAPVIHRPAALPTPRAEHPAVLTPGDIDNHDILATPTIDTDGNDPSREQPQQPVEYPCHAHPELLTRFPRKKRDYEEPPESRVAQRIPATARRPPTHG